MASAVSMLADTTLAGAPVKSAAKSSVVITADPDGTVNRYREILLKTQAGRSLFERLPDKTSEGNGVAITIRAGFPEHLNSVGSTTRHTEKNFKPWPPSLHPYETHVTFDVIIDVTKIADNIRACEDRIKRKVTPGTYDLWDDYTGAEVLYHELMAHVDLSQDRIEDYQALLDDLSRKVGLKAGLKLGDFPVTDDRRAKIEHALYGASTTPVKPKYEQTPIAEILRQLDTLRREDREREAREKEAREKAAHPKAKTPAH
jgi:hypothetical protein